MKMARILTALFGSLLITSTAHAAEQTITRQNRQSFTHGVECRTLTESTTEAV